MEKVSVFISDWQVLFREGIHFTLSGEEDMEVIGEEVENERALAFLETNPPQVAILNAGREKPSGIETTRRIKQNLPDVSVILVLDTLSDEQLFNVAKSGASAWLTKDVDPEVVIDTVREVAHGSQPITEALLKPEIASRVLDQFEVFSAVGEKVGGMMAHLTSQEAEILRHVADGKPREEIAGILNLGEEGISHRIASILHKLVANDQKLMLIEAAQSGLSPLSRVSLTGKPGTEYITKEEFAAFKESLKERFKSLGGEIEW
ncbi:MAG TPA: response regulator transcription factor [Dehalococcoidia bacterium]|jgi:DNA-binding NarL/FixJ family response regulator|nr:response regulator transcription factor [Dehalococcoidia bacterium]